MLGIYGSKPTRVQGRSPRTRVVYVARTGTVKCVLAFDGLCGARTGVAKHVLAFDSLYGARTRVAKRVLAFDSLCGAQTEVNLR